MCLFYRTIAMTSIFARIICPSFMNHHHNGDHVAHFATLEHIYSQITFFFSSSQQSPGTASRYVRLLRALSSEALAAADALSPPTPTPPNSTREERVLQPTNTPNSTPEERVLQPTNTPNSTRPSSVLQPKVARQPRPRNTVCVNFQLNTY